MSTSSTGGARGRPRKARVPPSERLLEALARSIAKPDGRALEIHPDNSGGKRLAIRSAVKSGAAFAVEPAEQILVIDHDDSDPRPLENYAQALQARGVNPVVVSSGRPGHRHLFARLEDAAAVQKATAEVKALGLSPRGRQAIRPPLSPHRQGLSVELRVPNSGRAALEALVPSAPAPGLSPRATVLLRYGDLWGDYPAASSHGWDRSAALQTLANDGWGHGWNFGDLLDLLLDGTNMGGERLQVERDRRGPSHAEQYLKTSWEKAISYRPPPYGMRAARLLQGLAERASSARWTGRCGQSDYAVLMAHVEIATRKKSFGYAASSRQVAELSGLSRQTVLAAQVRLVDAGWLRAGPKTKAGAEWVLSITGPIMMITPPRMM